MNILETLKAIRNTLECVEVHGSVNMDRMLGCIQAVRKMEEEMEKRITMSGMPPRSGEGREEGQDDEQGG